MASARSDRRRDFSEQPRINGHEREFKTIAWVKYSPNWVGSRQSYPTNDPEFALRSTLQLPTALPWAAVTEAAAMLGGEYQAGDLVSVDLR